MEPVATVLSDHRSVVFERDKDSKWLQYKFIWFRERRNFSMEEMAIEIVRDNAYELER